MNTGFEDHGNWTSHEEEADFLAWLATNDRVSLTNVGKSVEGRDIRLITIGSTSNMTILVICAQHGNEPSGREAGLIWARELAESTDPEIVAFLQDNGVAIMPTVNPDRVAVGTGSGSRANANGVDLNRNHISVNQPETIALHSVLRDGNPLVALDIHEMNYRGHILEMVTATHPQVDSRIKALGQDIIDSIGQAIEAAGMVWKPYAGGNVETIARNMLGLRNIISVLAEIEGQTSGRPPVERVDAALIVLRQLLSYVRENLAHLEEVRSTVVSDKVAEGNRGDTPFNLRTAVLSPPPIAYKLTASQLSQSEIHRDLFRVRSDGDTVTMGQESQPIIPFLFDDLSEYRVVSGSVKRVTREPEPQPEEENRVWLFRDGLSTRPILGLRVDGATREVIGLRANARSYYVS